jgi:agmatine deiminase
LEETTGEMITDKDTNTLYLNRNLLTNADTKDFGKIFIEILQKNGVNPKFIEYPKYYWCRDYLPVQVTANKFVQFDFDPDYLDPDEKIPFQTLRSLHDFLEISTIPSDLKIDGGNVIKGYNKVILTNKIFQENKKYTDSEIIKELSKLFNGSELIIIPALPGEMTGHADGIVRIIDDSTVLVSDFSEYNHYKKFNKKLLDILNLHFTDVIPVPYFELDRKNKEGDYTANGCYINFLWIGNMVFLPEFGHGLDDMAISVFRNYFDNVIQVPSNGISEWGGVLNCISWNILKHE